jgi:hypothetical protein
VNSSFSAGNLVPERRAGRQFKLREAERRALSLSSAYAGSRNGDAFLENAGSLDQRFRRRRCRFDEPAICVRETQTLEEESRAMRKRFIDLRFIRLIKSRLDWALVTRY